VLARLMASPRMPAALVLMLDMWVGAVRDLMPQRGQPPLPAPVGAPPVHRLCNFIRTQCEALAWWAGRAACGQLPGGEQLRALAADPRRGVAMRLHVLGSLLERLQGMEPAGEPSSGEWSAGCELAALHALGGVQALAQAVDGAARLHGGAVGAAARGAAGGGPASQQRPEEQEEQREREAQRSHAALVSELLGELLVGQVVPAGHLDTGAGLGAGAVALGQQQQAQPGQQQQQQQRVGPAPAPVKLPGLLQAAGCWHLGCMRVGGSARTQACEGCGLARYCGPGCQRAHWPLHRAQCLRWRGQLGGAGAAAGAVSQEEVIKVGKG
jgi:hypothetical protein